jgi:uncharacterized protein (UPF0276 family)
MSPLFKDLGIGVGLRPAHRPMFLDHPPASVSWVEVISENYMPWEKEGFGKSFQTLSEIRKNYPVFLHGVSLNLGSIDPLDPHYLSRLKQLVDQIEPFIISDHLSWSGINGEVLHDLLPLPYTQEALELISSKIDQVQNYLGRRILIENPSTYLEFKNSEMSEVEFINLILNKTDCGLLLDVNNVYVSSVNHGFDPKTYLNSIPSARIGQIHLAGHSNMGGYLIDTHDEPVCQEVWDLFRYAVELYGTKSTMIERDDHIPEWKVLELELLKIGAIQNEIIKSSRNAESFSGFDSTTASL